MIGSFGQVGPGAAQLQANLPVQTKAPSGDFQTFLRMLTTQIQYQNPLEPIEASDFAVQLATFSSVEQQTKTNDLLAQIGTRMGLAELGNWIGQQALSAAPAYYDGAPLHLVPPEVVGANRAELIISDLTGQEVRRVAISPDSTDLLIDLADDAGAGLPHGHYKFSVESFAAGQSLGIHPTLSYNLIEEARNDAGLVLLVLRGGYLLNSDDIVGLRQST